MSIALTVFVVFLIFLNGATDAANAIASSVASGALSMRRGAVLSAVCNMAGGVASAVLFSDVGRAVLAETDFAQEGMSGALAALIATVLCTALAWMCRIPTSESHALLAAAAGAGAALGGRPLFAAMLPTVLFMTLCVLGGFLSGVFVARRLPRALSARAFARLQVFGACLSSFFHGAQDLPKFLALLAAAGVMRLSEGFSLWLGAALVMGIGTLLGGRRMTEAVGEDLATLTHHGALSSDFAAAVTLLCLSVLGVPASTTHAKTAAVAGASLVSPGCRLHRAQLYRFLASWAATFPICAALGCMCARLLVRFV